MRDCGMKLLSETGAFCKPRWLSSFSGTRFLPERAAIKPNGRMLMAPFLAGKHGSLQVQWSCSSTSQKLAFYALSVLGFPPNFIPLSMAVVTLHFSFPCYFSFLPFNFKVVVLFLSFFFRPFIPFPIASKTTPHEAWNRFAKTRSTRCSGAFSSSASRNFPEPRYHARKQA